MKKYIFALLILIGCQEDEIYCIEMKVSNALPVQFWRNGVASFNQSKYSGVDKFCWFQPINCDDENRLLVESESQPVLRIYEKGKLLDELEFTPILLPPVVTTFDADDITAADAFGVGNNWDDNQVTLTIPAPMASDNSNLKYFEYEKPAQTIKFTVNWQIEILSGFVSSTSLFISLRKSDLAEDIVEQTISLGSASTSGSTEFELEAGEQIYYIGVYASALSGEVGECRVTVSLIEAEEEAEESGKYELEFSLSDYCGKNVSFGLANEEDDFYSDVHQIRNAHRDTRLIYYTNKLPFAGIAYDDNEPVFSLRVLSKFFELRMQQEDESEPDAEGNVVKLSGSVKPQKHFIAEAVPPYMVEKLTLIFKHSTIWIENEAWIAEETVEIEKLDERSPFFNVSVWLTKADNNFYSNVG